ncbi:MAG TPA: AraC family transcriptional regulator [Candidatus Limnocylindrales bacterium]|nr:AraC family transcriptional regulator [Candidatus Limnocylindrales bacterium]
MDALSEVLKIVKLRGALFFNAEFSAPWGVVSSRSADIAPLLCPGAGHVIIYHYLAEGRAYAQLLDGSRRELGPGDVVIFPHGDAHTLGNGAVQPIDSLKAFGGNLSNGLKVARYGGGGELTRFVCGYMACDPNLSEVILAGLPPMFVVNIARDSAGRWLANSIQFSVSEAGGSGTGSDVVLAKLSEVLFVETLRRFVQDLPDQQKGWLAGARDPVIGEALALLHKDPAHSWTIANLAHRVGVSRTRFVERFRHFLGEPPMAYLARWRLKLAAEILVSSNSNVGEIAAAVGYASEAAFNRVFKREFGCPPAQFRRTYNTRKAQAGP